MERQMTQHLQEQIVAEPWERSQDTWKKIGSLEMAVQQWQAWLL